MTITKAIVRTAYKELRTHEITEYENALGSFKIIDEGKDGFVIEDPEGKRWLAKGDKRVVISEFVESKVCVRCGNEFEPSRFTPYQKYCNECGGSRGPSKPDREEVECKSCGQMWERSKFLPYQEICPTCTKAAKLARAKDKRAAAK